MSLISRVILGPLEERETRGALVLKESEDRREALANQDNRDNQVDRYECLQHYPYSSRVIVNTYQDFIYVREGKHLNQ